MGKYSTPFYIRKPRERGMKCYDFWNLRILFIRVIVIRYSRGNWLVKLGGDNEYHFLRFDGWYFEMWIQRAQPTTDLMI